MVAIKNAFVPSSCYFCPMTNDGFYLCKANNPYRQLEDDCEERRPDWCPLIPIPAHGDLIDYDFCMENYELLHDDDGSPVYAVRMRDINNAPTIIPAEEGET